MKDDLGDRMKVKYEDITRYYLPRQTYTIIRLDGRAFHTYTKNCQKPFDLELMTDMNQAAITLCESIAGAQLAYVQSDEISLVLTDFATPTTEAWYDNNLQKIVSVSASIATSAFNKARLIRNATIDLNTFTFANFDARAFTISDRAEVFNYLIWRQLDAMRNSVSMLARSHFSHNELNGINVAIMKKMLAEKNSNWNDLPNHIKHGRVIKKCLAVKDVVFTNKKTGITQCIQGVERHVWTLSDTPFFVKTPEFLEKIVPLAPKESAQIKGIC